MAATAAVREHVEAATTGEAGPVGEIELTAEHFEAAIEAVESEPGEAATADRLDAESVNPDQFDAGVGRDCGLVIE